MKYLVGLGLLIAIGASMVLAAWVTVCGWHLPGHFAHSVVC